MRLVSTSYLCGKIWECKGGFWCLDKVSETLDVYDEPFYLSVHSLLIVFSTLPVTVTSAGLFLHLKRGVIIHPKSNRRGQIQWTHKCLHIEMLI